MKKLIKIILLAALLLLVIFSLMADMAFMRKLEHGLNLAVYIRLASLFSLMAAAFYAWSHKRQVEQSQKYRRANEVLEQAEHTATRREAELDHAEARMKADFAEKEASIDKQIGQSVTAYQERLNALKQQNIELRETVNKLMRALKTERAKHQK